MSNRYFHREFLAQSNDDSSSASIVARVSQTQSDYLSAGLLLSDGYDNLHLSFSAFREDEAEDMVRRADMLASIFSDFAKALKAEVGDVKKKMKEREKELAANK